jgi:hypothetical protein
LEAVSTNPEGDWSEVNMKFPKTKKEFIKMIESVSFNSIPERLEGAVVPQGLSRTRTARDHYYFREGDRIAHIAHKFKFTSWCEL